MPATVRGLREHEAERKSGADFYIPSDTVDSGRLHPARKQSGIAQRWNWRTHAHYGRGWWNMTHAQVSKELRMMSHRRKL